MSKAVLERLQTERRSVEEFVASTLESAQADERDLSATEIESLERSRTRIEEIDQQIAPLAAFLERQASAVEVSALVNRAESARAAVQVREPEYDAGFGTLGSFVESEEFRAYRGVGTSSIHTVASSVSELRAPLTIGTDPGKLFLPSVQKYAIPQGVSTTPLLDSIGRLQVSQNAVEMVTYGTPQGATGFDVVPEGQLKPEAAMQATTTTVTVQVVAAHSVITRQLLEDAPAVRGIVDQQLRRGLITKAESMAKTAIEGGTYTKVTGNTGESLLEVARRGMASVQTQGFSPNALLVTPEQAAEFDLKLLGSTLAGATAGQNVWGLSVIPVPGLAKPLLGDFRTGITMLERTGVSLYISDSHADLFLRNMFVILAEARFAFHVTQPQAVVELETKTSK